MYIVPRYCTLIITTKAIGFDKVERVISESYIVHYSGTGVDKNVFECDDKDLAIEITELLEKKRCKKMDRAKRQGICKNKR